MEKILLMQDIEIPRDIEVLGWCPVWIPTDRDWVGVSLTSWGERASLALVGHRGVTITMSYALCFTSTSFTPHLFLLNWLKLNLAVFVDHLKLATGDERCW